MAKEKIPYGVYSRELREEAVGGPAAASVKRARKRGVKSVESRKKVSASGVAAIR